MVVLVEPVALERDPDLGEHLLHRGATDRPFRFAGVGFGALGEGVVAEGLPHLEHLAGAFASVVIGRHGLGGYRRATRPAPYDGAVLLAGGIIVAYLIGTFPTALMVGRRIGADPSREGSGNPGASNVYRLGGRRAGVLVAIVDMLKGAVPVAIALLVAGRPEAHAVWAAATAGHIWPVTRRFRGGKGVATAGGGGIVIGPIIGLACALLFVLVVKVGRVAALGSLSIAVAFPVVSAIAGRPGWEVAVAAGVAGILVIRHQSNIRRMVRREEGTDDPLRGSGTAA